jgi:hypothetical protein
MIAVTATWADVAVCVGIVAWFIIVQAAILWSIFRECDRHGREDAGKNWPPPVDGDKADANAIEHDGK